MARPAGKKNPDRAANVTIAVMAAALVAYIVTMSVLTTPREPEGRIDDRFSAQTMWCPRLDHDVFAPRTLTRAAPEDLDAADCVAPDGSIPDHAGALLVATSGTDRFDMALKAATQQKLTVAISVPGEGCAVTADWRGDMVLVVATEDAEAPTPEVRFVETSEHC